MDLLNKFINEYATVLLYTALTAIFGVIAAFVKKKYNEWADTKIKKEVVQICVTAVEQLYKELDGPAKKEKAVEAIADMLAEKGIAITPLEINILIEACLGEFNGVFDETAVVIPEQNTNTIGFEWTPEDEYETEDNLIEFDGTGVTCVDGDGVDFDFDVYEGSEN